MVLEGSLVLEIGAAGAEPELPAVLLVGAPVATHSEGLHATPPARVRLRPVLPLEVRLQSPQILERLRACVPHVIPAPHHAAVARRPHQNQALHHHRP